MKFFIFLLFFLSLILLYILYLGISSPSTPFIPSQRQCFEPGGYCDYFELSSNQNNELFLSILFSNPTYDSYDIDQLACSDNLSNLDFSYDPIKSTSLSKGQKSQITVKCIKNELANSTTTKIFGRIKQKINGNESTDQEIFEGTIYKK